MTPTTVAFVAGMSGITVMMNGREYVVGRDHPNYTKIKDALVNRRHDELPDLMDTRSAVRKFVGAAGMALENDQITLAGVKFSRAVTAKVLAMIESGNPAQPIANFLNKVMQNPSKTAQDELFLFCVANGFMIHEDGDILAYKSVRDDYTDIHSGKVLNKVGTVVKMPRNEVDDNRERTCSTGLHFAAHGYATSWHSRSDARLLVIKVNPANVVSIPSDYGNQKARTSEYEIVAEIAHDHRLAPKEVYERGDFDPHAKKRDRLTAQMKAQVEAMERLTKERAELDAEMDAVKSAAGAVAPTQLDRLAGLVARTTAQQKALDETTKALSELPAPAAPVVPATSDVPTP